MGRRRVSVELGMDTADYMAHGRGATVTTKALKSEINDLGDTADNTARDVKGLGRESVEAAAEMTALGAAAEAAKVGVRGFDDQSAKVSFTTKRIDEDIKKLENELKKLAQEYERTGSTAIASALKQARAPNSELNRLRALRRELTKLGGNAATGSLSLDPKAFSSIAGSMQGMLIPAAIGAGVLLSPVLGAIIAGAVTGAVGVGGIAGGIAAAAKDPEVKAAAGLFGQEFSTMIGQAGKVMVGPTIEALDILKSDLADLHLEKTFAIAAPFVTVLARGIGDLATHFMPGFNSALAKAGPVIAEIGRDLPMVGDALGAMLNDMADGKGTVEGVRMAFDFLNAAIRSTGSLINTLSTAFRHLIQLDLSLMDVMAPLLDRIPFVNRKFEDMRAHLMMLNATTDGTSSAFHRFTGAAAGATEGTITAGRAAAIAAVYQDQMKSTFDALAKAGDIVTQMYAELIDASTKYINTILSMKNANLAWKKDLLDIRDQLKQNGKALDDHSQKGIANSQFFLRVAADAERFREELIAQGVPLDQANAKFQAMIKSLEKHAIAAGFSKTAVHALLDQLLQLPGDIKINVDLSIHGAAGLNTFKSVLDQLAAGLGPVAARVTASSSGHGFAPARASGGPVLAGGTYKVGERGPELLTMGRGGGFVTSHAPSMAALSAAPVVNVTIHVDPIDRRVRGVLITDAQGRNVSQAKIAVAYP